MKIREARAHCDIPCAVYDPAVSQYAALSVLRFLDLIAEMPDSIESKKDLAHLTRLVQQKEEHAIEVKDAVRTIWGDYFKEPHIEKYPEIKQKSHACGLGRTFEEINKTIPGKVYPYLNYEDWLEKVK